MNERRKKLIEEYYKNKIKNAELLLDNIWDPHNVAAIMRSADGFGIEKILLYYTYNKFPDMKSIGKKSSSSANKWIKVEKVKNLDSFVKDKKSEGFIFVSTEMSSKSIRLPQFEFPEKVIIMMGSEKDGLSRELKEIADISVTIPMVGMVKSYNVSVATAIFLYELFKQKGQKLKLRE